MYSRHLSGFRLWRAVFAMSIATAAVVCFAAWQLSTIAFADAEPQPAAPVQDSAYLLDCSNNATSKPATFDLTCGNGTYALDNLQWRAWGSDVAQATGTYFEKDCTPNCVQGMLQGYPVTVEADEIQRTGTVSRYTRLSLQFDGAHPQWLQDGASASYDVSNTNDTETRNPPAK